MTILSCSYKFCNAEHIPSNLIGALFVFEFQRNIKKSRIWPSPNLNSFNICITSIEVLVLSSRNALCHGNATTAFAAQFNVRECLVCTCVLWCVYMASGVWAVLYVAFAVNMHCIQKVHLIIYYIFARNVHAYLALVEYVVDNNKPKIKYVYIFLLTPCPEHSISFLLVGHLVLSMCGWILAHVWFTHTKFWPQGVPSLTRPCSGKSDGAVWPLVAL